MGWISKHAHFLGNSSLLSCIDCAKSLKTLASPHLHRARIRSGNAQEVVAFYGLRRPPYKLDALEPYLSQKMVELHWGEYQHAYVEGLNKQLEKNDILYGCAMDELVKVTYNNGYLLPEFKNAAQCTGDGNLLPEFNNAAQCTGDGNLLPEFSNAAQKKRLEVVKTSNAITPLEWDGIPILALNVWERAYYLYYKNDRGRYVNAFMDHLVSWNAATSRMIRAEAFVNLSEPTIPVA